MGSFQDPESAGHLLSGLIIHRPPTPDTTTMHFAKPFTDPVMPRALALSLLLIPAAMHAAPVKLVEQSPVNISRLDDSTVLVDFGRVSFGNLELKLPDGASKPITVHFGEAMKGGRINRKPPGTVRYNRTTIHPRGRTTVIAEPPADGRNDQLVNSNGRVHPPAILTPKDWGRLYPFRWVEVEGWPGDLKPEQINPFSPPSAPVQGRLHGPPAKSKFLAAPLPAMAGERHG